MEEQKRYVSSMNDKDGSVRDRSHDSYADKGPSNPGDERRKSEDYHWKSHTSSTTRNLYTSYGRNDVEENLNWRSSRSSNATDTTHRRQYQRDSDRTGIPSRTLDDLISPYGYDKLEGQVLTNRHYESRDDDHNRGLGRDALSGRQSQLLSVDPYERSERSESHSRRGHDRVGNDNDRRRKYDQEGYTPAYESSRHRHHHRYGRHRDSDRSNGYRDRETADDHRKDYSFKNTPDITDRTDSSMEPERHGHQTSNHIDTLYRSSPSRSHSHSHARETDQTSRHPTHDLQGEGGDDNDDHQERGGSWTRTSSLSNRSRSSNSSTSSVSSTNTARRGSSSRLRDRSHSQSRNRRSRSRSRSRSKHRHGHRHGSGSKRSSHKERRDDDRDAKDRYKRKRRNRSDSRDKKRRKRKEKEKEKARGKEKEEERRSVLTGKKIKLKVKKDKGDHERDANRKDLLQFLNSTFS